MNSVNVSALIFCKNEQSDIPGCINSLSWCKEIYICDSGSTDRTVEIAAQLGAVTVLRTYPNSKPFGGDEASHKNWALRNIAFNAQWVFILDADERCTDELRDRVISISSKNNEFSAYLIKRRDYFLNTWLKHVTPSPFNIRLVKPEYVRFERITNPVTIVEGEIGTIDEHFNHYPFSKGLSHWFDKHNGYSSLEAAHIVSDLRQFEPSLCTALLSKDLPKKRMHQKAIYYKLPLRPLFMFAAMFIFKRGFLDGRAGLLYCLLRAIYEFMILIKVDEARSVRDA